MPPPQSLLVRREEDGHRQERRRRTRIAKEPHCNSLTPFKIRPIAFFHSCRRHELYPLQNGVDGSPSLQSRFQIFGGRGRRRPHRGQTLPRVNCHLFPCQVDCDLAVMPEIIYFSSFSVRFSFLFKHLTTTLPSSTSSAVAVSTSFPRFNSSGV